MMEDVSGQASLTCGNRARQQGGRAGAAQHIDLDGYLAALARWRDRSQTLIQHGLYGHTKFGFVLSDERTVHKANRCLAGCYEQVRCNGAALLYGWRQSTPTRFRLRFAIDPS